MGGFIGGLCVSSGMDPDPNGRPSASQLVQLLDFIMRKVCTKNTAQLYIDFESGEIPSLYQQSNTYPINSNTVNQQEHTLPLV